MIVSLQVLFLMVGKTAVRNIPEITLVVTAHSVSARGSFSVSAQFVYLLPHER